MIKKGIVLPLLLLLIFSSCVSKIPLTDSQKIYAGKWIANDGTWIHIYNNGSGDFKMSNSNVTGGSTEITDDTITIGILGIKSNFKIDESPYEIEGTWYVKLSGIVYYKEN